MGTRNRLHSFTLQPNASNIIHGIRKREKSSFASKAIVRYSRWHEWYISKERMKNPDMIFYQLEETKEQQESLMSAFNHAMIENLKLKEDIEALKNAIQKEKSKRWFNFWKS